jgi:hypothetical protein
MRAAAIFCSLAVTVFGQLRPNVSQPTNIDFSEGAIGQMPPGWAMPPLVLEAGYRTEIRQEGCGRFPVCVAYLTPEVIGKVRVAELTQTFPAEPYIGKSIRFSAWLRLQQGHDGGYIHIRMRVDYADRHVDMRDSLAPHVIDPNWVQRSVFGHVKPGAVSISIWARYVPSGFAWIASPKFEVVDDDKVPAPTAFGVATGSFPVKDAAGKTLRFGAWIKTENVTKGYAGLWCRVDGQLEHQVLSFDNSSARSIDGKPADGDGTVRGATGTSDWTWHEIELPVPMGARNINFGFLLDGNGKAWFDAAKIELNGEPYFNPEFDLDFESATMKGFPFAGDSSRSGRYNVGIDHTQAFTGQQSLEMHFVEPEGTARKAEPGVKTLDPATVDDTSRSTDYSTPVPITFINHSSGPVDIYWIDYQGHRMLKRSELPVGASWRTGTFLTHPWLVVAAGTGATEERDTGLRLAAFEASSSAGGEAMITDLR